MAVYTSGFNGLALAMLLIAGTLFFSNYVSAAGTNCRSDIVDLASKCEEFVAKQGPMKKPSYACCQAVKKANVPCVCSLVTKEIENLISMEKVVYVAKSCGKKVAPGTKCGSYTVPSS